MNSFVPSSEARILQSPISLSTTFFKILKVFFKQTFSKKSSTNRSDYLANFRFELALLIIHLAVPQSERAL